MSSGPKVGVLAVQGAFAEHCAALEKLGARAVELHALRDIEGIDALILPGGESTTQGRLLRSTGLFAPLKKRIEEGLPVWGTCAGMILLASRIENDVARHFSVMDITVGRNGYGRQLSSFSARGCFAGTENIEMPFIRAPKIMAIGAGVEILSEYGGFAVAVREKNMLASAFHPEITQELCVHEYFLSMIKP